MYNVIVVTHGAFALGICDTLSMIMGKQDCVDFASFTENSSVEEYENVVRSKFELIDKGKQVLFLSDLYGGTPHNIATRLKIENPDRVEVISGVNLPLLMASVLKKDTSLINSMNEIMQEYQNASIRVELNNSGEDDE